MTRDLLPTTADSIPPLGTRQRARLAGIIDRLRSTPRRAWLFVLAILAISLITVIGIGTSR